MGATAIGQGESRAGEVDEQLLAAAVDLPHGALEPFGEVPVVLTELRIAVGLALGVVLGAANMVGVITSAGLLRRFTAGHRIALEDGRHLIAFAVCGGIVGPVIGATCATGWFVISAGLDFWPVWITWWIADAPKA